VVERHRLQRRFRRELFRCRPNSQRNMVLSVDWCESRMLALGRNWNVIERSTIATIRPELKRYAASFVVAYLQDLCRRRFALGDWRELSDAHAENILRDMARFVREQEGDDAPILAANAMIRPAREDGHAAAFAHLIAHWLRIGTLTIADYEGQFRGPILVRVAEGFLFNHDLLTDLAKDKAVDVPSIDQVTEVLDSVGVLVEERADCWVLNGDWLEQHVKSAVGPLPSRRLRSLLKCQG
jgi:hypothetical protein